MGQDRPWRRRGRDPAPPRRQARKPGRPLDLCRARRKRRSRTWPKCLARTRRGRDTGNQRGEPGDSAQDRGRTSREEIGRASCMERVCQYVSISVGAVSFKKKQKIEVKVNY